MKNIPYYIVKGFAYLLIAVGVLLLVNAVTGCNSTKLNKSYSDVNIDSSSHTVKDSTNVINNQQSDNKKKDSVGVSSSVSVNDLSIYFDDSSATSVYTPVQIINSGDTLKVDAGGRKIKSITDRKAVSKHDSTAVQKKDRSSLVNHDSVSVKKTLSVDLKKDTVDKTKDKKSSRVPIMAFVMLAVFLILCLVIIHYWSKIEAFFKL